MDTGLIESLPARPSAAEMAHAALRAAILSLALPPGVALDRAALARRLGVSQTPLREALIRLRAEGLVEVVPQSATRVARISLAAAREGQVLRLAVEVELLRRLAARPDPALAAALRGICAAMDAAPDEHSFHAADEAFHDALYRAAGVPGLRAVVTARGAEMERLRRLHLLRPGKAARVRADHEALARAVAAGDAAAAEATIRAHLSGTVGRARELRARHPDYFAPED